MAPFKRKPPQPAMRKAELRAQGVQALAQGVTTPITKLPMKIRKIRRQCKDCGRFNSVLVELGEAVPAFKCSTCQLASYHEAGRLRRPHQEPFREVVSVV
jgi:hypothetical protein